VTRENPEYEKPEITTEDELVPDPITNPGRTSNIRK
jgi:hypothetical protein